ncbi:sigma-54-dependent Fis family transcriptional regulator [Mitsuaria sp. GD03876]|uniref:sigma-54-dependent Fis family transcriptional regulator n=1 Tax=Mitsuaria sp. GD03876 TaxID=2975399 RepID=UPI0024479796|nr:sigma-54-dependent Fis family transcriptional regulator [Mitsuaria sp. GD03876]MDH0864867.1 sigma-54-dependent Fis family transcriptional regulator [Mitsuaria sp. GD03876]
MVKTPSGVALAPRLLRAARRELLDTGRLSVEALDERLGRSWLRSRDFGLSPAGRPPGAPHASGAQLRRALERQHELVAHARPVMEDLFEQTRDSDGLVILADAQGLLLGALGDGRFVDRAQRVALRPGAIWDERWRGTNAIGTALAEQRPVAVLGGEHFLERNAFLSCTAAPIRDPQGRVLGVLDISGEQRGFQRHTLALVRSAARMVEHRLFQTRHADGLRLQLHAQPEGLGTPTEGLLALSEDGWILGCNAAALAWLGAEAARASPLDAVLPVRWAELMDWARQGGEGARLLRREDAPPLWVRLEAPRGWLRPTPAASAEAVDREHDRGAHFDGDAWVHAGGRAEAGAAASPVAHESGRIDRAAAQDRVERADALQALDLGDAAMHQAVLRARRVLDKPIPLLLQGESGVGKDLFARAVHDSGPRRDQPYVAVNCAALPESLIEAELFGYRPGAFTGASREGARGRLREAHGGTLFLDEIGDMPLPLQARLLRVLQDRLVQPLGGGPAVAVDFQLIGASHRPLRQLVAQGQFREDLYYRLNGLTLSLPPLRERQDLPLLVARLLAAIEPSRPVVLDPALARELAAYPWPGNVRQLEQALRIACALMEPGEAVIRRGHLPDDLVEELDQCEPPRAPASVGGPGEALASSESMSSASLEAASMPSVPSMLREQSRAHARRVLADCDGNHSEAARRLGIGRNTLYRLLRDRASSGL